VPKSASKAIAQGVGEKAGTNKCLGSKIWGIDISPKMIKVARNKAGNQGNFHQRGKRYAD
jgi:ubiquinone/menaquinone biosynthesis C-methylase UbiE